MKEYLQRNDFKDLRGLLADIGLLDEAGLTEIPRWQPTVNFMTYHQKATNVSKPIEN